MEDANSKKSEHWYARLLCPFKAADVCASLFNEINYVRARENRKLKLVVKKSWLAYLPCLEKNKPWRNKGNLNAPCMECVTARPQAVVPTWVLPIRLFLLHLCTQFSSVKVKGQVEPAVTLNGQGHNWWWSGVRWKLSSKVHVYMYTGFPVMSTFCNCFHKY